jgi:hypothetical protein
VTSTTSGLRDVWAEYYSAPMPPGETNWAAYSHEDLHRMLWQDADVAEVGAVADEWGRQHVALADHAAALRDQQGVLHATWDGEAGERAAVRLGELADRVDGISTQAGAAQRAAQDAGEALARARAMMPPPPAALPWTATPTGMTGLGGVAGVGEPIGVGGAAEPTGTSGQDWSAASSAPPAPPGWGAGSSAAAMPDYSAASFAQPTMADSPPPIPDWSAASSGPSADLGFPSPTAPDWSAASSGPSAMSDYSAASFAPPATMDFSPPAMADWSGSFAQPAMADFSLPSAPDWSASSFAPPAVPSGSGFYFTFGAQPATGTAVNSVGAGGASMFADNFAAEQAKAQAVYTMRVYESSLPDGGDFVSTHAAHSFGTGSAAPAPGPSGGGQFAGPQPGGVPWERLVGGPLRPGVAVGAGVSAPGGAVPAVSGLVREPSAGRTAAQNGMVPPMNPRADRDDEGDHTNRMPVIDQGLFTVETWTSGPVIGGLTAGVRP